MVPAPLRLSFSGWGHVSKYYYVIASTGIWNQTRNNIEITCKKEIIIKNVIQNTKKRSIEKCLHNQVSNRKSTKKKTCNTKATDGQLTQWFFLSKSFGAFGWNG